LHYALAELPGNLRWPVRCDSGRGQQASPVALHRNEVAYPLLRVETEEVEVEGERGLPPSLLRPASIESLDLQINRHLSPLWTTKAADLAKLAPQLAMSALQQRGGADEFACHALEGVGGNGLLARRV
jgi:hypothetical protein